MKKLLVVTALLETGAGLALLFLPNVVVGLLLVSTLDGVAGLTAARIAGAALLALGVACWLARGDLGSAAGLGLTRAMVVYNLGAVFVLGAVGMQTEAVGILLWPAVLVHFAMGVWCLLVGVKRPT